MKYVVSELPQGAKPIVQKLYDKLTAEMGVTWQGNYLTVRFRDGENLVQVMCMIVEVDDGEDDEFDPTEEDK